MKTTVFKKLIKEAVREVIQEELKDILLEAVRSPKQQIVTEHSLPQVDMSSKPSNNPTDVRQKYMNVLNDMTLTSQDAVPSFQPLPGTDPVNGSLPAGELSLDQINNILNP